MERYTTATHWGAYEVEVEHGKISAMVPFAADPDPSPIGYGMPQALNDPVRIRQPMVRKAWLDAEAGHTSAPENIRGRGPFIAVTWERAIDLVSNEITRVRKQYGNGAIYAGSYGWASAGWFHHAKSQLHRFMSLAGGYVFSKNTYSLAAGDVLLSHVIGMGTFEQMEANTPLSMVAEHTDLLVSFGGIPLKNSQVEGGGMGQHHVLSSLRQCQKRGVKFVNFGPIRSDMADFVEAEWHASRPNTDTAIMLGLAHTVVSMGLHNKTFLNTYCEGFEQFSDYLLGNVDGTPKDAKWAGEISGIDPDIIGDVALKMTQGRTLINLSWSTQRADHGEQAFWMGAVLAAILGQIGLPGGGFGYGYGAVNSVGRAATPIPKLAFPGLPNPVSDYIPVARVADMLLNPGTEYDYDGEERTYPDIKIVYWCGGNPFHHHQDINRLVKAWQRPDTVIVHEPWWNANARHADIILPVATTFERNDIGSGRADRFVFAMQKASEPVGQSKTDYGVFSMLAENLGFGLEFTEGRDEKEWLEHMHHRFRQAATEHVEHVPTLEELWKTGSFALPEFDPVSFLGSFREDPKKNALSTPSGKLEIFSSRISGFGYEDCPGHPIWQEPSEWLGAELVSRYPLHLITNQPKTRLHSQYDNGGYSLDHKIKEREPVTINPVDASERGIADGDIVRLFNDRGACLAGADISDDVMPGVIQLSTGAWYDPLIPGEIGSLEVHGNPNVLTMDKGTSKLAQGPSAMSALVEVELFKGTPPPVKIFVPPDILPEETK